MTETQAPYAVDVFTAEQIADIRDYLEIIQSKGGHGDIIVRVRDGVIRYINLGEVSKKYGKEDEK